MQLNLDKIKATLERAPKEFEGLVAQIGLPSGINYEDGISVAQVAAWNEFGTSKTPARPFIMPTVAEKKDEWTKIIAHSIPRVVRGEVSAFDVLDITGRAASADIQTTISKVDSPKLAESTIRAKGSSKPLVDTGLMLASVQSAVNKEGAEFKA